MKTFGYLAVAACAFIFAGCDLLDKADDVKFDTTIQIDWVADENGLSNK